jgi:hypothetical protein
MLVRGRHPLEAILRRPLLLHAEAALAGDRSAPGRRCGNCRFRAPVGGAYDGSFPKCVLPGPGAGEPPRVTGSAASDVRAWWPGCSDHQWRPAGEGAA